MTSFSIAVGCLAALVCGLIAGRCLRSFREGIAVASAIAAAVGLTFLHISKLSDLMRIVQPKVALDWLPFVCLLAAVAVVLPSKKLRIALGTVVAMLTPVRLLWGSVYLQPDAMNPSALMCLAVWVASLAIPMVLQDQTAPKRVVWKTALWVAATAVTAIVIAMSGSLTYGAASGVCGLAILGVLISMSQISNIAAIPFICLIGLSASFSELSVWNAGLLLSGWVGVLISERVSRPRTAMMFRVSTAGVLLIVGSLTLARLADNRTTADISNSGYDSFKSDRLTKSKADESLTTSSSKTATETKASTQSMKQSDVAADPFDGLDLE